MVVSRLRTSFATSPGTLCPGQFQPEAPLGGSVAVLISISNSARRSAPRASRFFAVSVFFDVTLLPPDISKPLVKI